MACDILVFVILFRSRSRHSIVHHENSQACNMVSAGDNIFHKKHIVETMCCSHLIQA